MAGKQLIHRDSDKFFGFSGDLKNYTDMNFEFLEDSEMSNDNSVDSVTYVEDDENADEEGDYHCHAQESKKFWESQNEILQATMYRISSLEMKIRQATKDALKEIKQSGLLCGCHKPATGDCRNFLQRDIYLRLQDQGYNCGICKSKWRSTHEIPSGEHSYLEVVGKPNNKRGEVRIVIELNFRAEFEMARAGEEYNKLVNRLPEIFVGKEDRLRALIKILCAAGKKCMKERKMHLGPWRKHKYMQSKWLGSCERLPVPTPLPAAFSNRPVKPGASLLTFDMLENLPVMHCTAVKVL